MAMQGYDLPPELDIERRRLERQQRIADALSAQGNAPLQMQSAGGYVVPISPFAGAAKLLSAYAGKRKGEQSERGMEDIGRRYNEGLAQAVRDYTASGSPRQVQAPDFGAMTGGMDEQDVPMRQETVQADPRERLIAAMTSPYAPVRQLGTMDFQAGIKEKELSENRAFRQQESDAARQFRAQEAQAAREARADELRNRAQDARATEQQREQARREIAQMNIDARREMAAMTAANRPERMITVMDPNGNAITVPQSQAGGMPVFNPQAAKQIQDTKKKGEAKEQLTETVGQLKGYYDALKDGGGIVEQGQGTLGNIASRIQSSAVGQLAGGAVGTKNQEMRQKIEQTRPLLLNLIKNATGMSAQQMNSNAEMQLYLRAATDPTLSYEANVEALGNLDKLFGLGLGLDKKPAAAPAAGGWAVVR